MKIYFKIILMGSTFMQSKNQSIVMHCIIIVWSVSDCMYDSGLIRLYIIELKNSYCLVL